MAQGVAGSFAVSSNAAPLGTVLCDIQGAVGDPAHMHCTEEDFERTLSTMKEVKPPIMVYAEHVILRNPALLKQLAERSLCVHSQIR